MQANSLSRRSVASETWHRNFAMETLEQSDSQDGCIACAEYGSPFTAAARPSTGRLQPLIGDEIAGILSPERIRSK